MKKEDAIRSGKRFRKKGWTSFFSWEERSRFFYEGTREEWLEDDWEVEEDLVEITKTQATDLYRLGIQHGAQEDPSVRFGEDFNHRLKELGF